MQLYLSLRGAPTPRSQEQSKVPPLRPTHQQCWSLFSFHVHAAQPWSCWHAEQHSPTDETTPPSLMSFWLQSHPERASQRRESGSGSAVPETASGSTMAPAQLDLIQQCFGGLPSPWSQVLRARVEGLARRSSPDFSPSTHHARHALLAWHIAQHCDAFAAMPASPRSLPQQFNPGSASHSAAPARRAEMPAASKRRGCISQNVSHGRSRKLGVGSRGHNN